MNKLTPNKVEVFKDRPTSNKGEISNCNSSGSSEIVSSFLGFFLGGLLGLFFSEGTLVWSGVAALTTIAASIGGALLDKGLSRFGEYPKGPFLLPEVQKSEEILEQIAKELYALCSTKNQLPNAILTAKFLSREAVFHAMLPLLNEISEKILHDLTTQTTLYRSHIDKLELACASVSYTRWTTVLLFAITGMPVTIQLIYLCRKVRRQRVISQHRHTPALLETSV